MASVLRSVSTTHARAEEVLNFPRGGVHMREVVKYSNYKPGAK